MKLQLKRSLKTLTDNITAQAPTVDQMEYGELAINYATTDATIFLKDSNNVIQKLQVSAVPDVPAGETLDDRYVSLSGSTLTGNLTAPSFIGGVARTSIGSPTTGQNGELWWNTSNGRLYIYDGDNSSWVDASPDSFTLGAGYYDKDESDARYVAKAGSTMTGPLLLSGNPGGEALAATPKQYVDGQVTGLDTTLRTYIDAQIATRAATTYVNTQLSLKADTTYVTSAITTSETAAATAYVSKSGDVISGDLTANAFIGDGSQLTGVGSETIISNTPPTPANYEVGTMWWNSDSTDTSLYILYQDPIGPNGDPGGKYWIEASPAPDSIGFNGEHTGDSTFTGNMNVTGNGTFGGNVTSGSATGSASGWAISNGYGVCNYVPNNDTFNSIYFNYGNGGIAIGDSNVTTSQNIYLNSDGSASFAGGLLTIDVAGAINTSSGLAAQNKSGFGDSEISVILGLNTAGTHTSEIFADGSAKFAAGDVVITGSGNVKSGDPDNSAGSVLSPVGQNYARQDGAGSTVAAYSVQNGGTTAADTVARINYDGSASFDGETIVKGDLLKRTAAGSTVVALRDDYLRVYDSPVSYDDYTISLEKDGSATFAASVNVGSLDYTSNSGVGSEIRNDGLIRVQRASGSASSVYQAWRGNLNTVNISADGSATFAGEVVAGVRDSQGVFMTSGGALEGFNGGSRKYSLSSDGSATFGTSTDYVKIDPVTNGLFIVNNGVSAINLDKDGSAVFTGTINGTTVGTSDIKFKENIEAAPAQLADIEAFELKTFDWKDEAPMSDELKSQRKIGLIAQEVEAICPEMVCEVAGQDEDSYKAINHDVLIMKLLGAVKELAAEVAALKAS